MARKLPPIETRFKKGDINNPKGAPTGKRISTWMRELGEKSPDELDRIEKRKGTPNNALIAIARIRKAKGSNGERSTEIILDRTEGSLAKNIDVTSNGNTVKALLISDETEG